MARIVDGFKPSGEFPRIGCGNMTPPKIHLFLQIVRRYFKVVAPPVAVHKKVDALKISIVSVALFTLATFSWTPTFAEIYEYKNAGGRTVRSMSPPPDAKKSNDLESSSDRSVGEFCRDKWGKNYEMREYCMNNQRKARRQLHGYPSDVLEFCKRKWDDNYEMIEHCSKNQSAAKRRLGE